EGMLMPHAGLSEQRCSGDLDSIVRAISRADVDNKWFVNAQQALNYGSPLSINSTYQPLTQSQNLSLKACFDMEFNRTL
ncbi:enoyl-CoA hydratase/isomerase family protein, partial [Vibrio parahaemolyticus]|nr:enoyl-CoA hydratase/isomerase family protein [Vibrio parahaemolyticus]